jgi:predicted deacylase
MTRIAAPPMPQRVICDHAAQQAGPTLVAIGGVHGNEPAGILAAQAVSGRLADACALTRGRFVALRGNLAALAVDPDDPTNNPRYLAKDLNRLFETRGGDEDTPDHAQRDALRDALDGIAAESEGPLVVLDLHTTSSDSPPFVAAEDSLPARAFAERFPLPLILGIEEDLKGLLMDEATARLGCVALTVEGGRHDDPNAARTLEAVLWIALETLGLVSPSARTGCGAAPIEAARRAAGAHAHRVYDIRHREPVSTLPYEPDAGVEPFERVRAHRTRIATQAGADLLAAESGLLFMPNRQRDIRVGDDAYFVVRRVGRTWLRLSAWLRTRAAMHRTLPRLLPGVRHRPGHPHDLLVDPEIAAVLRRELFHLLGYRLVRFESTPGRPPLVRAARAVRLTIHAVAVVIGNLVRLGNADADHPETETDWIVRRHRLDTDPPPSP